MTNTAHEFDCEDCGRHVIAFGPIHPTLCATCHWIRTWVQPNEQTTLRERLGVPLKEQT